MPSEWDQYKRQSPPAPPTSAAEPNDWDKYKRVPSTQAVTHVAPVEETSTSWSDRLGNLFSLNPTPVSVESTPSGIPRSTDRRGIGMGNTPPPSAGPSGLVENLADMPFSGGAQMIEGGKRLAEKNANRGWLDTAAGIAFPPYAAYRDPAEYSDIIEGGMKVAAPVAGPIGLVRAPLATLGGVAAGGAADLTPRAGWEWAGMDPERARLTGLLTGLGVGGKVGGMIAGRTPKPKYGPAPRTEAFGHALPPKGPQVPNINESLERAASEILRDSPDMGNGSFPLTRPGETASAIRDRWRGTLDRIWGETDQALQPIYATGARTPTPTVQANVRAALGTDPATMQPSWNGVSPSLRGEIESMGKREYSLQELWKLWHEWNADLAAHYNKGLTQQRTAELQGKDPAVMEARLEGVKQDFYNKLNQLAPDVATYAAEQMSNYSAVARARNSLESQLAPAYMEVPTPLWQRAAQGALGVGKLATHGPSGVAWAAPNLEKAVSADKTTAVQILKALETFAKGGPLRPAPQLAPVQGPAAVGLGSYPPQPQVRGLLGPGARQMPSVPNPSGPIPSTGPRPGMGMGQSTGTRSLPPASTIFPAPPVGSYPGQGPSGPIAPSVPQGLRIRPDWAAEGKIGPERQLGPARPEQGPILRSGQPIMRGPAGNQPRGRGMIAPQQAIQSPSERPTVSMDFITDFARSNNIDFGAAAQKLTEMGYRLPPPLR